MSFVLGDELFWLSLVDAGESQDAEPSQRRRQHAQLHAIQLSGLARRHFHARSRWHGDRQSRCAGAFISRGAGELAESESRMDLFAATDSFGRRFSGQTFNTHVPHTVRSKETKTCSDCHVSKENDNNAWLAQLLLQGTNFVNFMGRYVYIAADHSLEVVVATERDEPQAVFGSTLHKIAYPANYREICARRQRVKEFYEHIGNPKVLQVQLRGEYAYVAAGEGGLRVYDVAQIDQKGFSERIVTAPVSRFGQKFWVKTKYATAVAAPSTLAVDPARTKMTRSNEERNDSSAMYGRIFYLTSISTKDLIVVNAATLLDGDPLNNYLKRRDVTIQSRTAR